MSVARISPRNVFLPNIQYSYILESSNEIRTYYVGAIGTEFSSKYHMVEIYFSCENVFTPGMKQNTLLID